MAKRKWNKILELFRLSRLRRRAATRLAPDGLQSGLDDTSITESSGCVFYDIGACHLRGRRPETPAWGGSATQEEADAAALKHAAFSASLKNMTWEDLTPVFGACFVHNRWWHGEGSCPFCEEASDGKA